VKRIVMVTTELEVVAGSAVHARVPEDGCEMRGTAVGGGQPWTGAGVALGPARQGLVRGEKRWGKRWTR
jgi:hypothetical protein